MRAEENRLERAVSAIARSENISAGIDARLKPGRTHQIHGIFAAGHIGIRIGYPADPVRERAARRPSVDAQPFQALLQPGSIDAQAGIRTLSE